MLCQDEADLADRAAFAAAGEMNHGWMVSEEQTPHRVGGAQEEFSSIRSWERSFEVS